MKRRRLRARLLATTIFALTLSGFARAADRDGFLYADYFYDDRYSDSIFSLDAQKPFGSPASRIRPYGDFLLNLDSQTLSVQIPETLTDNYALGALGLEYSNGKGLRAFSQLGVTARVGALAAREPGGDVRAGVELYRGWGGLTTGHAPYGSYFGQATYTSRYRDTVFSNNVEVGRAFAETRDAVDVYLRAAVTLDSRSFYYANLVEGTLGFRVRPLKGSGLNVTGEKIFGSYLRGIARPADVRAGYQDFRISVGLGVPF